MKYLPMSLSCKSRTIYMFFRDAFFNKWAKMTKLASRNTLMALITASITSFSLYPLFNPFSTWCIRLEKLRRSFWLTSPIWPEILKSLPQAGSAKPGFFSVSASVFIWGGRRNLYLEFLSFGHLVRLDNFNPYDATNAFEYRSKPQNRATKIQFLTLWNYRSWQGRQMLHPSTQTPNSSAFQTTNNFILVHSSTWFSSPSIPFGHSRLWGSEN